MDMTSDTTSLLTDLSFGVDLESVFNIPASKTTVASEGVSTSQVTNFVAEYDVPQCFNCSKMKADFDRLHHEQNSTIKLLKRRMVSTDHVLKRYKAKKDDYDNEVKKNYTLNSQIDKMNRDSDILSHQLKSLLNEINPLKEEKKTLEEKLWEKSSEISKLQDKIESYEALFRQRRAVDEQKTILEAELSLVKKRYSLVSGRWSTEKYKVKEKEGEIQVLKSTANVNEKRFQKLSEALLNGQNLLNTYWTLLQDNGLVDDEIPNIIPKGFQSLVDKAVKGLPNGASDKSHCNGKQNGLLMPGRGAKDSEDEDFHEVSAGEDDEFDKRTFNNSGSIPGTELDKAVNGIQDSSISSLNSIEKCDVSSSSDAQSHPGKRIEPIFNQVNNKPGHKDEERSDKGGKKKVILVGAKSFRGKPSCEPNKGINNLPQPSDESFSNDNSANSIRLKGQRVKGEVKKQNSYAPQGSKLGKKIEEGLLSKPAAKSNTYMSGQVTDAIVGSSKPSSQKVSKGKVDDSDELSSLSSLSSSDDDDSSSNDEDWQTSQPSAKDGQISLSEMFKFAENVDLLSPLGFEAFDIDDWRDDDEELRPSTPVPVNEVSAGQGEVDILLEDVASIKSYAAVCSIREEANDTVGITVRYSIAEETETNQREGQKSEDNIITVPLSTKNDVLVCEPVSVSHSEKPNQTSLESMSYHNDSRHPLNKRADTLLSTQVSLSVADSAGVSSCSDGNHRIVTETPSYLVGSVQTPPGKGTSACVSSCSDANHMMVTETPSYQNDSVQTLGKEVNNSLSTMMDMLASESEFLPPAKDQNWIAISDTTQGNTHPANDNVQPVDKESYNALSKKNMPIFDSTTMPSSTDLNPISINDTTQENTHFGNDREQRLYKGTDNLLPTINDMPIFDSLIVPSSADHNPIAASDVCNTTQKNTFCENESVLPLDSASVITLFAINDESVIKSASVLSSEDHNEDLVTGNVQDFTGCDTGSVQPLDNETGIISSTEVIVCESVPSSQDHIQSIVYAGATQERSGHTDSVKQLDTGLDMTTPSKVSHCNRLCDSEDISFRRRTRSQNAKGEKQISVNQVNDSNNQEHSNQSKSESCDKILDCSIQHSVEQGIAVLSNRITRSQARRPLGFTEPNAVVIDQQHLTIATRTRSKSRSQSRDSNAQLADSVTVTYGSLSAGAREVTAAERNRSGSGSDEASISTPVTRSGKGLRRSWDQDDHSELSIASRTRSRASNDSSESKPSSSTGANIKKVIGSSRRCLNLSGRQSNSKSAALVNQDTCYTPGIPENEQGNNFVSMQCSNNSVSNMPSRQSELNPSALVNQDSCKTPTIPQNEQEKNTVDSEVCNKAISRKCGESSPDKSDGKASECQKVNFHSNHISDSDKCPPGGEAVMSEPEVRSSHAVGSHGDHASLSKVIEKKKQQMEYASQLISKMLFDVKNTRSGKKATELLKREVKEVPRVVRSVYYLACHSCHEKKLSDQDDKKLHHLSCESPTNRCSGVLLKDKCCWRSRKYKRSRRSASGEVSDTVGSSSSSDGEVATVCSDSGRRHRRKPNRHTSVQTSPEGIELTCSLGGLEAVMKDEEDKTAVLHTVWPQTFDEKVNVVVHNSHGVELKGEIAKVCSEEKLSVNVALRLSSDSEEAKSCAKTLTHLSPEKNISESSLLHSALKDDSNIIENAHVNVCSENQNRVEYEHKVWEKGKSLEPRANIVPSSLVTTGCTLSEDLDLSSSLSDSDNESNISEGNIVVAEKIQKQPLPCTNSGLLTLNISKKFTMKEPEASLTGNKAAERNRNIQNSSKMPPLPKMSVYNKGKKATLKFISFIKSSDTLPGTITSQDLQPAESNADALKTAASAYAPPVEVCEKAHSKIPGKASSLKPRPTKKTAEAEMVFKSKEFVSSSSSSDESETERTEIIDASKRNQNHCRETVDIGKNKSKQNYIAQNTCTAQQNDKPQQNHLAQQNKAQHNQMAQQNQSAQQNDMAQQNHLAQQNDMAQQNDKPQKNKPQQNDKPQQNKAQQNKAQQNDKPQQNKAQQNHLAQQNDNAEQNHSAQQNLLAQQNHAALNLEKQCLNTVVQKKQSLTKKVISSPTDVEVLKNKPVLKKAHQHVNVHEKELPLCRDDVCDSFSLNSTRDMLGLADRSREGDNSRSLESQNKPNLQVSAKFDNIKGSHQVQAVPPAESPISVYNTEPMKSDKETNKNIISDVVASCSPKKSVCDISFKTSNQASSHASMPLEKTDRDRDFRKKLKEKEPASSCSTLDQVSGQGATSTTAAPTTGPAVGNSVLDLAPSEHTMALSKPVRQSLSSEKSAPKKLTSAFILSPDSAFKAFKGSHQESLEKSNQNTLCKSVPEAVAKASISRGPLKTSLNLSTDIADSSSSLPFVQPLSKARVSHYSVKQPPSRLLQSKSDSQINICDKGHAIADLIEIPAMQSQSDSQINICDKGPAIADLMQIPAMGAAKPKHPISKKRKLTFSEPHSPRDSCDRIEHKLASLAHVFNFFKVPRLISPLPPSPIVNEESSDSQDCLVHFGSATPVNVIRVPPKVKAQPDGPPKTKISSLSQQIMEARSILAKRKAVMLVKPLPVNPAVRRPKRKADSDMTELNTAKKQKFANLNGFACSAEAMSCDLKQYLEATDVAVEATVLAILSRVDSGKEETVWDVLPATVVKYLSDQSDDVTGQLLRACTKEGMISQVFLSQAEQRLEELLKAVLKEVKSTKQQCLMSAIWTGIFCKETKLSAALSLCRLLTALCKAVGDTDRVRLMVYKIAWCGYLDLAWSVLAVVGVWPEVMIVSCCGKSPVLSVIQFILLDTLKSNTVKLHQVQKALTRLCIWSDKPESGSAEVLFKVLQEMMSRAVEKENNGDVLAEVSRAMELLLVYKGVEWTEEYFLFKFLVSSVMKYINSKKSEADKSTKAKSKETKPTLIIQLLHIFNSVHQVYTFSNKAVQNMIGQVFSKLITKQAGTLSLALVCVDALIQIAPYQPERCLELLRQWQDSNGGRVPAHTFSKLQKVRSALTRPGLRKI